MNSESEWHVSGYSNVWEGGQSGEDVVGSEPWPRDYSQDEGERYRSGGNDEGSVPWPRDYSHDEGETYQSGGNDEDSESKSLDSLEENPGETYRFGEVSHSMDSHEGYFC